MNFFKDYSRNVLIFLFTYFLILNLFQLSHQHWSSMLDQDIKMMYNSLLISSGIEQEYKDHPAYTTFLILGSIFKICSIFFDNFTIQEILNSENIDENLQTLFAIGRIVNGIYIFFVSFVLFKILKELNIKKEICILSTLLIIFFQDTYELLFLIRSEVLSILMILLFFYLLIKFIKKNKVKHILSSGFFLCLAMLAKIQVIFLFFPFLVCLPFLMNHLKISENRNNLVYRKFNYIFYFSFLTLFLLGYIFFQVLFGNLYGEVVDRRFYFLNNMDLIFLVTFICFYYALIKILTWKKLINSSEIIITISLVLMGFTFCVIFVLFLDLINLIPFNKLNLMRLANPFEYMVEYSLRVSTNVSVFDTIRWYFFAYGQIVHTRFNPYYDPYILYVDPRVFFRTLHLIFFISLIYFSSKKNKNTNLSYFSISLYLGIFLFFISFTFRETFGYNFYLFPLYLILASILINKLEKKFLIIFYFFLTSIFIAENIVISEVHKNSFTREPRVYDICDQLSGGSITVNEKWKNSTNYIINYNNSSFIQLVDTPVIWFETYVKRFDNKFLIKYCNQMK